MNKSAYIAFTAPSYRVLNILATLGLILIGFLADVYIGTVGIVMLSTFGPVVLVFLDYFAFSGASTRRQRTMNYMKSSFKGEAFFRSALKTDIFLKEICLLFSFLGYIIAEVIYFTDADSFVNGILVLLIYLPVSEITMCVTLIISRKIALSVIIQTAVCYFCSMISTFLLMFYSFIVPEQLAEYTLTFVIMFFLLEAIHILCAVLLYRDCVKGYTSSFTDTAN